MKSRLLLAAAILCLISAAFNISAQSLAKAYEKDFLIGTALNNNQILEKDPVQA